MKFVTSVLALSVGTLLAHPALAAQPLLRCSGSDLALSSMMIQENADGTAALKVRVSESDDAPTFQFNVQFGLKDLKAGSSATIIAQKVGASQAGGAFENAVLLRVLDGQKSAVLAMAGTVYRVRCY